jgi:uncharacterized protein YhdP
VSDTTNVSGSNVLEIAIRESWTGRLASGAVSMAAKAWPSSDLRRCVTPIAAGWTQLSRAQQIRAAAVTIAVAMLVERAMRWLAPRSSDPMSAVLPIGVLVASLAVAALAAPLARLAERLNR